MPSENLLADGLVIGAKESRSGGVPGVSEGLAHADDLDLVRRGDEGAIRRVIHRYTAFVYRIALGITGCEADAADVTQEVFIALPELLHTYEEGTFVCWLKVVAVRKALMLARTEERQAEYTLLPTDMNLTEDERLIGIMLERALGRLEPRLRMVFLLWELEGFTHREIADVMGTSENVSQVRLFRARRHLRRLLT